MSHNRSKGTSIEKIFAELLRRAGLRYKTNDKSLEGKPDFSLSKSKVVIFCDGDFWHGKDWELRKHDHKSNVQFWYSKIERNKARDREVNQMLEKAGWRVFRFWESEIKSQPYNCLNQVLHYINEQERMQFQDRLLTGRIKKGITMLKKEQNEMLGEVITIDGNSAIISHYLHNRNTKFGMPYEAKALKLMDYSENINSQKVVEKDMNLCVFKAFFSVPFLPPKNQKFTFIDLFAGIGGFRMAMQNLGGKCVFSSEWDAQAQKTYLLNYGEVPFGDITSEETKSFIPDDFDVLCAGFPCQAFSLAGKKLGFEEARGTLFFEVAEVLRRKQPKAFFLENVKGLIIHDRGRTFETILRILRDDLGYYVPDPQVVNAEDFGTPQHRERVYIVGFRKDQNGQDFEYPEPTDNTKRFADIKEESVVSAKYYLSTKYLKTLEEHRKRHEAKGNGFGYQIIPDDGIANAIVVGGMGRERNLVIDHRLEDFTPVTNIKGEVNRKGIRRMTPREWARLQGFPESFIIGVSDAAAYKQFGNSVAVPAIQATAKNLLKCIKLKSKVKYEIKR